MLERLFACEVDAGISGQWLRGIYQPRKSQLAELQFLQGMGLVQQETHVLPGRFQVTVKGWTLTDLGRLNYCMSCDDEPATPPGTD